MTFMKKENFDFDTTSGAFGLKVEVRAAGGGTHPVDSVTGKVLSTLQCEAAKDNNITNSVKVVVTS